MPLRALIFDVDGTLAQTESEGHRLAFNQAFREAGLDWHWDVARYGELLAVTGGKERMLADLRQRDPAWAARWTAGELIAHLHRRKNEIYAGLLSEGRIGLRPGVERLLREARAAGLRLAIASTTSPENVFALLRTTLGPLGPRLFEVIGAGDIVPHKKPAADIYLWVLRRLHLAAEQCLAIEDSAPGLQAALGAGLPTVITTSEYTEGQSVDGALAVLDGLGMPGAPARGTAAAGAWHGVVDVATLNAWHQAPPGA